MDASNPIDLVGKADALCVELLGEAEVIRLARLRQLKADDPTMYSLVRNRMEVLRDIANPKVDVILVYKDQTHNPFRVPGKEPPKVVLMNTGGVLPRVFALRCNNYYDEVTPVYAELPKPPKV